MDTKTGPIASKGTPVHEWNQAVRVHGGKGADKSVQDHPEPAKQINNPPALPQEPMRREPPSDAIKADIEFGATSRNQEIDDKPEWAKPEPQQQALDAETRMSMIEARMNEIMHKLEDLAANEENPEDFDNYVRSVITGGDLSSDLQNGVLRLSNTIRNWYVYDAVSSTDPNIGVIDVAEDVKIGNTKQVNRVTAIDRYDKQVGSATEPWLRMTYDLVKKVDGQDYYIARGIKQDICKIQVDVPGQYVTVLVGAAKYDGIPGVNSSLPAAITLTTRDVKVLDAKAPVQNPYPNPPIILFTPMRVVEDVQLDLSIPTTPKLKITKRDVFVVSAPNVSFDNLLTLPYTPPTTGTQVDVVTSVQWNSATGQLRYMADKLTVLGQSGGGWNTITTAVSCT